MICRKHVFVIFLVTGTGEAFVVPCRHWDWQRSANKKNHQPLMATPTNDHEDLDKPLHLTADMDDDDISQHSIMVDTTENTTGYRPIESWHNENRNPTHVLDSLKREQAHWKGKFEDLGGDGI